MVNDSFLRMSSSSFEWIARDASVRFADEEAVEELAMSFGADRM